MLSGSLFNPGGAANSYSLLLVVLVTFWLGAGLAFALDVGLAKGKQQLGRSLIWTPLVAAMVGFVYALARSEQIVAIGPFPGIAATESAVLGQAHGYDRLFLTEIAALVILIVGIAWSLIKTSPQKSFTPTSRAGWISAASAVAVMSIVCWEIAINPLRADIYASWAAALDGANRSALSPTPYRRAITINPQTFYLSRAFELGFD